MKPKCNFNVQSCNKFVYCRLQVASHTMREVPYARLIDSSPTTGYLPVKLDSDSRLNTLSALNVPHAADDVTPKSSISDSKLAVDYFITNATPLSAEVKDSEVRQWLLDCKFWHNNVFIVEFYFCAVGTGSIFVNYLAGDD